MTSRTILLATLMALCVPLVGCSESMVYRVCKGEDCRFFDVCDVDPRGALCWNLDEDKYSVFGSDITVDIIKVDETVAPLGNDQGMNLTPSPSR